MKSIYKNKGGEIMLVLQDHELMEMHGKSITATALLTYVAIVAGCAAIIKILTSSKGRLSIPGITFSWG